MIDRAVYLQLLHSIVSETAPEELPAFDLSAATITDELYERGSIQGLRAQSSEEFQFIESATHVLEFVALMVGTFEAVRKLYRSFKKSKSTQELKDRWATELQAAGLAPDVAGRVVARFASELEVAVAGKSSN